jgi:hypothetical protein
MDFCKNDNHSKNKKEKGWNGKCGNSSCFTTATQFSIVFSEIHFINNYFDILEKIKLLYCG